MLEEIKVGDKIVYRSGGWNSYEFLTEVKKVTPKQFTDSMNNTFRKSDGAIIGNAYIRCHIASDEDINRLMLRDKRAKLQRTIKAFVDSYLYDKVSVEDYEAMNNIIQKYVTA